MRVRVAGLLLVVDDAGKVATNRTAIIGKALVDGEEFGFRAEGSHGACSQSRHYVGEHPVHGLWDLDLRHLTRGKIGVSNCLAAVLGTDQDADDDVSLYLGGESVKINFILISLGLQLGKCPRCDQFDLCPDCVKFALHEGGREDLALQFVLRVVGLH